MKEKDINLLIKPRNARILRTIRANGFKTVGAFCAATGLSATQVGCLTNMTKSPINRNGEFRRFAVRLATALRVDVAHLWPDHLRRVVAKKSSAEIGVSLEDVMTIASAGSDPIDVLEKREIIHDLLTCITPRERRIISARMDSRTLQDVGEELGISLERVRLVERRAIRKMRRRALNKFGIGRDSDRQRLIS